MSENTNSTTIKTILTQEEYLNERLEGQMKYHRANGSKNKSRHFGIQVLVIVCSAIIPILIGYADKIDVLKYIAGGLGALVSISTGVLALYQFRESWSNSRATMEGLRREKYIYLTRSGNYKPLPEESSEQAEKRAYEAFVLQIEEILSAESDTWRSLNSNHAQNKVTT